MAGGDISKLHTVPPHQRGVFRVSALLARGRRADVWWAEADTGPVALRVPHLHYPQARFEHEQQHTYIASGRRGDLQPEGAVEPLVRGDSLADLLEASEQQGTSIDARTLISIAQGILKALMEHPRGHGHLKPSHVLIGEAGTTRLIDADPQRLDNNEETDLRALTRWLLWLGFGINPENHDERPDWLHELPHQTSVQQAITLLEQDLNYFGADTATHDRAKLLRQLCPERRVAWQHIAHQSSRVQSTVPAALDGPIYKPSQPLALPLAPGHYRTNSNPPQRANSNPPQRANSNPPQRANSNPPQRADSNPPHRSILNPPQQSGSSLARRSVSSLKRTSIPISDHRQRSVLISNRDVPILSQPSSSNSTPCEEPQAIPAVNQPAGPSSVSTYSPHSEPGGIITRDGRLEFTCSGRAQMWRASLNTRCSDQEFQSQSFLKPPPLPPQNINAPADENSHKLLVPPPLPYSQQSATPPSVLNKSIRAPSTNSSVNIQAPLSLIAPKQLITTKVARNQLTLVRSSLSSTASLPTPSHPHLHISTELQTQRTSIRLVVISGIICLLTWTLAWTLPWLTTR
ncbi:MAG: hypothetical protein KTR25_19125 [Myxococcales bacterium]|nr:hypothetical protein [Myxococcales bacterium]